MSRIARRYIVPLDTATGLLISPEVPHGEYTLVAGATYAFCVQSSEAPFVSFDLTGYDAALVVTSATIQDTNHPVQDVSDVSVIVGEWKNERPTNGYVAADGTGWSVGTGATACVVAAAGSGVGGAMWQVAETGAFRTRLLVVVGGTGGRVRVSACGK